ncbi:sigma factor-like helix-turn-helix DNA-binding protein [Leptolyngbya sp. FACHB-671]|uniref:sigma factor-like helix-turn-helix DNA-binding protein n=1 Tax=Leptolyngbya sp. FACHB-671 TaxID=2692812 RepID=UPI001689753A|nr:sigma factor-like helix-turn-helix DNA-binding protein [Leptolyngbya sp. FACHB-671]
MSKLEHCWNACQRAIATSLNSVGVLASVNGCKQPLSKVAETVHLSRERIRQRESKAFAQLRR